MHQRIYFVGASTNWRVNVRLHEKLFTLSSKNPFHLWIGVCQAERTGLDVELLRLPENLGAGIAKRVGIQKSKAEFVTFLDFDDMVE